MMHGFISLILPWPFVITMMCILSYMKRLVFLPRLISYLLIHWLSSLFFCVEGPQVHISIVTYHGALLFPIHLAQALVETSSMCLSCVRIPVQWCNGYFQRSFAIRRRGHKFRPRSKLALLGLLALSRTETAYAIPSTGYGLVNERSLDNARQIRNVQNVVNQLTSAPSDSVHTSAPSGAHSLHLAHGPNSSNLHAFPGIKTQPEVFIADTDSAEFLLDTGTNGFIVNDSALLQDFSPERGHVKGVNGSPTSFAGAGLLNLRLKSDCGSKIQVTVKGVYVPKCPYNLLSPQLLISELKRQGMSAECRYDDRSHTITFDDSNGTKRITSLMKSNRLFSIRANEGYRSFFCHAVGVDPQWCSFAGSLHVVPTDDHQGIEKPKEVSFKPSNDTPAVELDQTKEADTVHVIEDDDESTLVDTPRVTEFGTKGVQLGSDDPSRIILHRKQSRLATIHERLGHLSFGKLRLLARARLIPGDLADVPPPQCPGCAYGKAHRKPIRHK